MYIDQITLTNFRGYYGENTLQFSTDSSKNISIVAGNNGFGKTTLLTALIWGLYGKLMSDVDEIYRSEIYQAGGYNRYCHAILNRLVNTPVELTSNESLEDIQSNEAGHQQVFGISIIFSQLNIPHLLCDKLEIKRNYNCKTSQEQLEILIDGKPNELTKNVGLDVFINDFILPKEIAKFFFFDAEKIVSMAEIKTIEQKRYLSQAYAEVLGIKKYTDLKVNLENLQLRLRNKTAVKSDRDRLDQLNKQVKQNEKLLSLYSQQILEKQEIKTTKKITSDKYQEQLIREGSYLTLDEFKKLKEEQAKAAKELNTIKLRFNEMLELAPFAMLFPQIELVKQQLEKEANHSSIGAALLDSRFQDIKAALQGNNNQIFLSPSDQEKLLITIKSILLPEQKKDFKPLLDFTTEQQNGFLTVYDNLKNNYKKNFKVLVADQKRAQSIFQNLQRRLRDAESKEKDPVITQLQNLKCNIDRDLSILDHEIDQLNAKVLASTTEIATLNRQASELSKKVSLENADLAKDQTTTRIITKLNNFIDRLKNSKKQSLEINLRQAFNHLLHKADFIKKVNVSLQGEFIDIELLDQNGYMIKKESLSKGEQQLYTTALLKALIIESKIEFPVFIDSPLQKLDKLHSEKIIIEFYPNLSSQVVLLPLLQKELSIYEYGLLLQYVGKSYFIEQRELYKSVIFETQPTALFEVYNNGFQSV